ncbi:SDR family NAD(P)-dependent oxidoreductase [Burkholderiaceae bacterium UC74_6]
MSSAAQTILITGCSSGIGAALAREFAGRGHRVIATARRIESLCALAALPNVVALPLDVDSSESIGALLHTLNARSLMPDMLINNAGFGCFGPMLDVPLEALRAQFETNVFAPVQLSAALLPLLRQSPRACIAHVGSISGLVTTPFAGAYCASKAAIHAVADAMRLELAPLGVRVVTIQPGAIASEFGNTGEQHIHLAADSPFAPIAGAVKKRARASQSGATPAAEFTRIVADHLLDANAGPICRAGALSTKLPLLKRLLPMRRLDAKLRSLFGLDQLAH